MSSPAQMVFATGQPGAPQPVRRGRGGDSGELQGRIATDQTHTESKLTTYVRRYNLFVAVGVAGSYLYAKVKGEDVSAMEYLFDVGVHAFQATVRDDSHALMKIIAGGLDLTRSKWISSTMAKETNTIPDFINRVDMFNHGLNLVTRIKSLAVVKSSDNGRQRQLTETEKMVDYCMRRVNLAIAVQYGATYLFQYGLPEGVKVSEYKINPFDECFYKMLLHLMQSFVGRNSSVVSRVTMCVLNVFFMYKIWSMIADMSSNMSHKVNVAEIGTEIVNDMYLNTVVDISNFVPELKNLLD